MAYRSSKNGRFLRTPKSRPILPCELRLAAHAAARAALFLRNVISGPIRDDTSQMREGITGMGQRHCGDEVFLE